MAREVSIVVSAEELRDAAYAGIEHVYERLGIESTGEISLQRQRELIEHFEDWLGDLKGMASLVETEIDREMREVFRK